MRSYIGMNKAGSDSALCWIRSDGHGKLIREIYLKERFTRQKGASGHVGLLLKRILPDLNLKRLEGARDYLRIGESSFFHRPRVYEDRLERKFPFFSSIQHEGLALFSQRFNPHLHFVPHHLSHAFAARAQSPFRESLIVVMDGGGSYFDAFDPSHPERRNFPCPWTSGPRPEVCSVYLQEGGVLTCVRKEWQRLRPFPPIPHGAIGDGLGTFYDAIAFFIFGSRRESGKVMGLAPYGVPVPVRDRLNFVRDLDWSRAFQGGGKRAWEASPALPVYRDLAATAQAHFEQSLMDLIHDLATQFPRVKNLILTGGCALNCVANAKVMESGLFRQMYIPPFPSDESIALGVAESLRAAGPSYRWSPTSWKRQRANFGPRSSVPTSKAIREVFPTAKRLDSRSLELAVVKRLLSGQVVAWFQGQSESGPRALGYRSLLAHPMRKGMKDYLNQSIKGRENFRPFGCALIWEEAHRYFEIEPGFNGPFMSYAVRVRKRFRKSLAQVTHVDGTSRIQTVRREENPRFYRLLKEFGRHSGFPGLLNTSLNVMGEPLVETLSDAHRLFQRVPVDCLVIGSFLISRFPEDQSESPSRPLAKPPEAE